MPELTMLYRPVGQAEYDLIQATGRFPPRLAFQPIFYPVMNEEYAAKIARDWNTKDPASGYIGYVLRFNVNTEYVAQFEVQTVGSSECKELWILAERLDEFNENIVGDIETIAIFGDGKPPA